LQVLFTERLGALLHLPAPLLTGTGWFLLAYAATVGIIALRDPLPRAFVGLVRSATWDGQWVAARCSRAA